MKITVTIGSTAYPGTETPPGPSGTTAVSVPTPCPVCGTKHAVIDGKGIIRALSSPEHLVTAQREVRAEFGPCTVLPPPLPEDGCRVQLVSSVELHDGWDGAAQCIRCRQVVGTLAVRVSTLFGVEEDAAVLELAHARSWRVF